MLVKVLEESLVSAAVPAWPGNAFSSICTPPVVAPVPHCAPGTPPLTVTSTTQVITPPVVLPGGATYGHAYISTETDACGNIIAQTMILEP